MSFYNTVSTAGPLLHKRERLGVDIAQTGNRISRDPATFEAELRRLPALLRAMPAMLAALGEAISPWEGEKNPQRKEYCARAIAMLKCIRQDGLMPGVPAETAGLHTSEAGV